MHQLHVYGTGGVYVNPNINRIYADSMQAGTFYGALSGNASTASHATKVQSNNTNSGTTMYINGTPTLGTGSKDLYHSNEFYFTPSNGYLYATRFVGYLQGNISGSSTSCSGNSATASSASSASVASTVTTNYSNTNANYYINGTTGVVTGNKSLYHTNAVYFNASNDYLYAVDVVATSDERLKDRVGPIENALDKVNTLDGFLYTWNDNYTGSDESVQVGVSAQQVEKVLPEAVDELETGYKGVSYGKLVPLLIEAMKELTQENKLIRSELENLKSINT